MVGVRTLGPMATSPASSAADPTADSGAAPDDAGGASPAESPSGRWPAAGLALTLLLVLVATALPPLLGWNVRAREDGRDFAPLHGFPDVKVGLGTVPAVLIAYLGWRYAADLAARLDWRRLLLLSYVASLAWMLSLAFVDGPSGISRVLGNGYEYLTTARQVDSVPVLLAEYVSRIPYSASPDNWPTHVAGHPPLPLLFFVALVRVGLGGDFAAGMVVTVLAATTAAAVLVTLRALGAEAGARRAAPFLVLTPAAVFMAVSADALFTATAAWGLAALALGATAPARGGTRVSLVAWSVLAGLLLGGCVLMSYGLPLLGVLAIAVLALARSWWPLPVAVLAALVPVLVMAALGFAWWEAYPVLVERYHDGIASERPASYWAWGNLAALAYSAGPLLGAGLARAGRLAAVRDTRELVQRSGDRVLLLLFGAATTIVVLAELSGMSKAEVERIWLPFIPWLTLSMALLPARWRSTGLALQLVAALLVQHLLYTSW